MKCQFCGNDLPEIPYAQYCPYCGKRPLPIPRLRYLKYQDLHYDVACRDPLGHCFELDRAAVSIAKKAYGLAHLHAPRIDACPDEVVDLYHDLWGAMRDTAIETVKEHRRMKKEASEAIFHARHTDQI